MLNRRGLLTAIAGIGILGVGGVAHAKGPHKHSNGHNALGAKLKQNGKHEVGKAGKETVSAEVNNGKVVNMSWYPAEDVIVTDTWVEYVPA